MRKRLAFILFVAVAAGAALAGPVAVKPGAKPFTLGAFKLYALRDMLNVVPNDGKVFGADAGPAKVSDVLKSRGQPVDKVTLAVDALLVKTPNRVVLLDTGLGPKIGGALMQSLALTGTRPAQVTDILITHRHSDHVGGLLTADGKPAFPRATVHISATDWDWLKADGGSKPLVAAIGHVVKTFKPGSVVIPGFRSVSLAGHTAGHTGYEITSGKQRLIDIGDIAHSSIVSLEEPEWTNGYDAEPVMARATREAHLARLAASRERLFAPHFPFPGVGTIRKAKTGYVWVPAKL
jgi:glyoxylase-like metal-dependent hydrolase (beta-lactamase superfamily II)